MARIACLQIPASETAEEATELAVCLAKLAINKGASILCLPEYCGGLRTSGPQFSPPIFLENIHPLVVRMQDFAVSFKVWVLVGSVAVVGPDERYYNRSLVIDDKGAIIARYDKLHLFDVDLGGETSFSESDTVCPGKNAVVVQTPFGTLGLSICYDVRFSALYNALALAGATILTVPAAFTKATGEAHWHILNKARAIETGSYVVAPCMIGSISGGGETYGHSLIVDPWGRVLADGGTDVGVVVADVDPNLSSKTRKMIPNLTSEEAYSVISVNIAKERVKPAT